MINKKKEEELLIVPEIKRYISKIKELAYKMDNSNCYYAILGLTEILTDEKIELRRNIQKELKK